MKKDLKKFALSLLLALLLIPLNFTSVNALTLFNSSSTEDDTTTDSSEVIDDTYLNTDEDISLMCLNKNNDYPIIMVHGLFGWGNDELLGINYWGGTSSLKNILTNEGFTVYTPSIGPISSNWDRACELYAYIVGGTVDYGQAHSEKYGHARYGRTYPGVYPQLSDENKIHLIGHSMGGETIRVLAQLLENGDADEINTTGEETNPLFKGGNHSIKSITTICTPHDGSQYDQIVSNFDPFAHDLFAYLAAKSGESDSNINLDLQMDQWGLKQEDGESYEDYLNRVMQSNIWQKTTDLSNYDLSLDGAKELNSWVKTQDDIYYFSLSCVDTHKLPITGFQVPNINMNPIMRNSSRVMGSYVRLLPNKVRVTKEWWRNDGIVSVRSAIAPHEGSTDTYRDYDGTAIAGTWNYLGEIKNVDHLEIVGQFNPLSRTTLQNTFINIAKMLGDLCD